MLGSVSSGSIGRDRCREGRTENSCHTVDTYWTSLWILEQGPESWQFYTFVFFLFTYQNLFIFHQIFTGYLSPWKSFCSHLSGRMLLLTSLNIRDLSSSHLFYLFPVLLTWYLKAMTSNFFYFKFMLKLLTVIVHFY